MKWLTVILACLFCMLQYRLWFGKNSVPDFMIKKEQVALQVTQNSNLAQRNNLLKADIHDLKMGLDAAEEKARNGLGLIKQGETFYRILPSEQ
ncbi:cell division protein FtsB [Paraglaciecola aquimarina]|uniref:Cell division protein FtsB n=1 Tax=Paraglaciecola algarum TaxID=3050085 RepID=A0ABS9DEK7_9ALTE|nr:cell division protein FtsB [Paraglaciecola sp. G1-23]MCF2950453.1 cell division protein FtsB [Paraglaciecola sp. G1-23]